MSNRNSFDTRSIAAMAIMSALTTVVTMFALPFAPTGGFFNLGDAIVMTTALIFGPIIGGVAGGLGSALADLLLGYSAFAPFTL
ncbi:MAG: ECF transporter S component, partial [Candidatus Bathyarchaeota archaeon]|nr:ECF transporter S component [Candidatus Bathyarchaeota archaeon]